MLYEERLQDLKIALHAFAQKPDGYLWRVGPHIHVAQRALRECQEAYNGWQLFKNLKEYQDDMKAEKEGEE